MSQTWKIRGQVYTHGQLMELRKQGIDPRKDDVVMKLVTPRAIKEEVVEEIAPVKKEKKAKVEKVVEEVVAQESNTEDTDQDGLPSNYMKLKSIAREKGMEITRETKKEDVLKFLESIENQTQIQ